MYLGKIISTGPTDAVFKRASHPYTQALLSAVPLADPTQRGKRKRIVLQGDPPSPIAPPSGCRVRTRCRKATDICAQAEPELIDRTGSGTRSACHHAEVLAPAHALR